MLDHCFAVWCSAADTHLKLMDCVVSPWCQCLTGGVFECDIAHCRSVAVLCMLYKIRCNPMHPHFGVLTDPYVPVQGTCSALVTHWYTSQSEIILASMKIMFSFHVTFSH